MRVRRASCRQCRGWWAMVLRPAIQPWPRKGPVSVTCPTCCQRWTQARMRNTEARRSHRATPVAPSRAWQRAAGPPMCPRRHGGDEVCPTMCPSHGGDAANWQAASAPAPWLYRPAAGAWQRPAGPGPGETTALSSPRQRLSSASGRYKKPSAWDREDYHSRHPGAPTSAWDPEDYHSRHPGAHTHFPVGSATSPLRHRQTRA
jgi:hypothetical protein